MAGDKQSFRASKAFDLLTAAPLIAWYGLSVGSSAIRCARLLTNSPAQLGAHTKLEIASQLAAGAFLGVQLLLFLFRRTPIAKAPGVLPG